MPPRLTDAEFQALLGLHLSNVIANCGPGNLVVAARHVYSDAIATMQAGPSKPAQVGTFADAESSLRSYDYEVVGWWAPANVDAPSTDPVPAGTIDGMKSRTQQALDILAKDPSRTIYSVAKQMGISESAIHRAISRQEGKTVCPCCHQVVRAGFELDQSVIRKLKAAA